MQTNAHAYNITWTTPNEDASGSMPLGNGDTGLNAWVEPNGDLCFYISKTDSWGDNGRLLKVGRLRFTLDPVPALASFVQTLYLESATLVVQFGAGSDDAVTLRLWVDANQPIIQAESGLRM